MIIKIHMCGHIVISKDSNAMPYTKNYDRWNDSLKIFPWKWFRGEIESSHFCISWRFEWTIYQWHYFHISHNSNNCREQIYVSWLDMLRELVYPARLGRQKTIFGLIHVIPSQLLYSLPIIGYIRESHSWESLLFGSRGWSVLTVVTLILQKE